MTSDQCKKSIISFNMALMLAFIFALCSISFSILLKDELQTAASDVLAILVDSLAALALFYAARRSSVYGRQVRMAWTVFALALVAHTLGDIAWAYTEIVLDQPPFPSMADWLFLIQYPLFIAGILLLPTQSLTSSERLKVMLDEGIVIIASVIIFWVALIAPNIESSAGADIRTQVFPVVYPVMGLMLLFALVELLFRRIRFQQMGPVLLLVMGTAVMIITDLILVY
ncbi:MAG: histidine kinase, partial [Methanothrix sp.]